MIVTPAELSNVVLKNIGFFARSAQINMGVLEQLAAVNAAAAREALDSFTKQAEKAVSLKDVKDFAQLQATAVEPALQKSAAYARSVYDVLADAQNEIKALVETNFASAQKQAASLLDESLKSAPQGSEAAVAFVKSTIASAMAATDTYTKFAKQMGELAEAGMATAQAPVKAATGRKK